MLKKLLPATILAASLILVGCGGSKELDPDFHAVLDRTEQALVEVDGMELSSDDDMLAALQTAVYEKINAEPPVYDNKLGIFFLEDASFLGFDDNNGDNTEDPGERLLFRVEIDAENNRLILTDETGGYHGRGFSATGLIAGALIGSMLGRQRAAGVNQSRFNNVRVNNAQPGRQESARSRARSGGVRGGK